MRDVSASTFPGLSACKPITVNHVKNAFIPLSGGFFPTLASFFCTGPSSPTCSPLLVLLFIAAAIVPLAELTPHPPSTIVLVTFEPSTSRGLDPFLHHTCTGFNNACFLSSYVWRWTRGPKRGYINGSGQSFLPDRWRWKRDGELHFL